jgi:ketosteroid isomerase-like protein
MTTAEVARGFAALLREHRDGEAQQRFWSDDVVSREAGPGPMAELRGKAAVLTKHDWWNENFEVHGGAVEGPWVHGDQFALVYEPDATQKGGARATMREVALYTVRDGRIVEERFFDAA